MTVQENSNEESTTSKYDDLLDILNSVIDLDLSNGFIGLTGRRQLEDALVCIAQNNKTPESLLVKLAKKRGTTGVVALTVAHNSNAPIEVFDGIEVNLNALEREKLAQLPNLPTPLLERLAGDVVFDVRCAVAGNANTSTEIQRILEDDDSEPSNKRELVINPDTPAALLQRFVDDQDLSIRQSLAAHPNASSSVLDYLIRDDSASVRVQVALNPNTSNGALYDLADDVNSDVQKATVSNPKTPKSILKELGLI